MYRPLIMPRRFTGLAALIVKGQGYDLACRLARPAYAVVFCYQTSRFLFKETLNTSIRDLLEAAN